MLQSSTRGQRVAKRAAGGVTYLHGDHLGSVGKTSGYTDTAQLYEAYGAKRGASEVDTPYRYTGQRWEENDALDIYYYKARWYDPALGRFLQPDTVVPSAANPQSLNRYSYVSNNPLRYTDPTGHAADSGGAGSDSHWVSDWHWKNRWYEAHGYFWKNGGWIRKGAPQFADEAITDEVIAEAGISLFPHPLNPVSWGWEDKQKVAYAVAMYGLKLRAGIAGLKSLLGGWATIFYGSGCCGSNCAPPIPFSYTNHEVDLVESFGGLGLVEGAQTVAHELAHVIDWQGRFSRRWYHHAGLTDYANGDPPQPYPRRWDNWAEAVTVWVFGDYDSNTDTFSTSYKPGEVSYYSNLPGVDLAADMNRMSELLNGWR